MGFLWFFLGMMVGGCLAVLLMCCLSIHRINKYRRRFTDSAGLSRT